MPQHDPFEIFTTSKLERIMNGILKDTIRAHGPVTLNYIPSASKRAALQLRAYFKQFSAQQLVDETSKQLFSSIEASNADLKEHNSKLKRQVAYLGEELRKIRDNEVIDPAEAAKQAIIFSREIKNEKKLLQNP